MRLPVASPLCPDTETRQFIELIMEVHSVVNHRQMDYNLDNMEAKHGKGLPCNEDRMDSGVESLKEDDVLSKFEDMSVSSTEPGSEDYEPWRAIVTEDGDTQLHLTIIHKATEYAQQMIKLSHNHSFLNIQNHQRQTALHLAVITEQPQLVDQLVKAGADPRLVDNSGNTPLHIACKRGSLACFGVITQNCQRHLTSILSTYNYNGHNCLHLASVNNYISLVESLIRLGADINAQESCSGRTALHLAVDYQNPTLVCCLLNLGANVNCLNYGGFAPYHLTFGRHDEEIRSQLYDRTSRELRDMPDSDSDDSDMEGLSEDEVYDDIKFGK